jgi:Ca2+-binding RTX toxin-like protein
MGGQGDDSYTVLASSNVITEHANEGMDTVFAPLSWTLGAHLENLTLLGTGPFSANGNSLDNILVGNAAANILNGGTGADTLIGGDGNDTYVVDNVSDVIQETGADAGDSVRSWVDWTLGNNLENLTLLGTKSLNGTGNSLNNSLTGNGAANVLNGGDGNDMLNSLSGNDTLIGGAGADTFAFTTPLNALRNVDTITDFASGVDKIELASAIFKDIGFTGSPSSNAFFHAGSAAQDANDRILYDQSTGALSYDADGSGGLAAVQFALLLGSPVMLYSDCHAG